LSGLYLTTCCQIMKVSGVPPQADQEEAVLNTFQPIGLQAGFLLVELTARRETISYGSERILEGWFLYG
ncbi:MAG: hypothetical protein KAR15_09890, partial [Desulfobacterales bacterium]|nr:hypothetical protein [Desulfobacterales bacterium]